jgi:autotransporter-associated beta strand protein
LNPAIQISEEIINTPALINMKPSHILRSFLLAAGSSLLTITSASAQTNGTWLGNANWWSDPASWVSGIAADGTGGTANFTGVNITGDINKPLGSAGQNRTIGNITFTDATPSHNLTISSNTLTLDVATGSPQINVTNQTLTISSIVAGSDGLTKIGAGTLALSGNNSYTGVTATDSPMILGHNNALGSTTVGNNTTVAATGASTGGRIGLNSGINTAENITITGATESSGFNSALYTVSGTGTFSGTVTLAGTAAGIRLGGGGSTIFSGTITQSVTSNSLAFIGTNTVSNAMTINGASIFIYNGTTTLSGASGSGIGNVAINQGATLQLGVTDALNTSADLTIGQDGSTTNTFNLASFNQTVRGLSSTGSTTRRVINSVASTTSTLTLGNGGGNYTFPGTILNNAGTGGTVALVKTGTGNQTLSGINTYTGGTRIDNGTLTLGHATDTLANTGAVNVNGGTLALGTNSDTVGAVTLTSGSITSSTGVLTGSSYGVQSGSVSARLGGTGIALTKTTAGTVTLTGTNSYTGATAVNAGTLQVSGSGSINTTSAINVAAGATFSYNSSVALTVAPTLNSTVGNKATFSGSGNLGTLAFTYNSLDDVISPGNSPGIQAYGASQTWSALTYAWELNDWADDVGGTDFDLITVAGSLNLSGTSYALDVLSLNAANATGLVGAGGGNTFAETSNSWTILTTTGGITNFDSLEWSINTAGFLDADSGTWSLSVVNGGNDLLLSYAAIPEPGAALLGSLGLLALLRRRR